MKILVCGKGGCGKSVIATLISKALADRGYDVLVIDGDESNLSLHRFLGLDMPRLFRDYFGSRKEVFERIKKLEIRSICEIPDDFIAKRDRIKLLCIGKIHEFGEGCACPMAALLREFLRNLKPERNEFVIVDTEAGIEHFGRAVEMGCDLILLVLDPTYESILLSKRITEMKTGKKVFFILNKVDETSKDIVLSSIDKTRVIAIIPVVDDIAVSCLKGEEINVRLQEIERVADFLVGMK